MESRELNLTLGMLLILIKHLKRITNYVLNHIIYLTNTINNIGNKDFT